MAGLSKYSSAAWRFSEAATQGLVDGKVGRWIAARLSDGSTDGVYYDSRAEAVSHQLHESLCCYVIITPNGMNPQQAESILKFYRYAYNNGFRITDPQAPDFILPTTNEDMASQLARLAKRKK